jgi:hypothetical protein
MLIFRNILMGLSLFAMANGVLAAPITLDGDHFTVTYESSQAGLYKQGFLSGSLDTVYFQPNTFTALSGGNQVSTQAPLQLTFSIDPGYSFAGLNFTERGDYFLIGGGAVNVGASVEAVNAGTSASTLLNLAPGTPLAQTGGSTDWELTGSLSSLALGAPQTLVVTLDNTLFASAPAGGLGFIQKTYAGFQIVTQPVSVPEPSGLALLLAGVMAAVLVGRRRLVNAGVRLMSGSIQA